MRTGMFLEALAALGEVDVLVIDLGSRPIDEAFLSEHATNLNIVETAGRHDSLFDLISRISDDKERSAAFEAYGKPSITASISLPVIQDLIDILAGKTYQATLLSRSTVLPVLEHLQEKVTLGSILVDLDDDDAAHSQRRADQAGANDNDQARWHRIEALAYEKLIDQTCRRARLVSLANRGSCLSLAARHVGVIPECIPNSITMQEPGPPVSEPRLLFVGNYQYFPNEEGVAWFIDAVFPHVLQEIPATRLIVAGSSPRTSLREVCNRTDVELIANPEDLGPLYRNASIAVVPLRSGSGTRIKILEAAAYGLPVVSTAIGAEGLDLVDGKHLWIGEEDGPAFARACVSALQNDTERLQRSSALRKHVAAHYQRHDVVKRISELITQRLQTV